MDNQDNQKKKRKKAAGGGDAGGEKEHKRPWQEVYATVEEIRQFLGERVYLRHNVVTGTAPSDLDKENARPVKP